MHDEEAHKTDPMEVKNQIRIMNAVRRREEWVNHQVGELSDSKMHDSVFRKGIYHGANPLLHDFRSQETDRQGRKIKQLAGFYLPKTPDKMAAKMSATKDGQTKTDKKFH